MMRTVLQDRILFAAVAAGGGHVATANALLQAVEALAPGRYRLELSDFMKRVGEREPTVAAFDRRHKASWDVALRTPWTARLGQRITDTFPHTTLRVVRSLLGGFAEAAARDLAIREQRIVVSTHSFVSAGLAIARRRHGADVRIASFVPEVGNVGAYWADRHADLVLVSNDRVRRSLVRWGVPDDRIEVLGWPVQQPFLHALDRRDARERLGLDDRFTILVSLGGQGHGFRVAALVGALRAGSERWQIVVACGTNVALRTKLAPYASERVRIEGYSDRMADFIAASDVVVGKAGPSSVHEALAVGRPVLITTYVGLNEWAVIEMLEREALGRYLPENSLVVSWLQRFERSPERASGYEERSRSLDLGAQTQRLARRIVAFAAGEG